MASKYTKTYSRKKQTSNITQFDKLVSEPGRSTHPIAAKTAGHVGKWGVTSFTSIRSINGGYSGKKSKAKRDSSDDPDSLGQESITIVPETKRRKFFKSRDVGYVSQPSSHSPPLTACITTTTKTSAVDNENTISLNKDNEFINEKDKINLKVKNKTGDKGKSGIKLKIFKSRNNDYNESGTYSSTVELPSDDSRNPSSSSSMTNSPLVQESHDVTLLDEGPDSPKIISDHTLDSSYEFNGLVDQRSGLAMDVLTPTVKTVVDAMDTSVISEDVSLDHQFSEPLLPDIKTEEVKSKIPTYNSPNHFSESPSDSVLNSQESFTNHSSNEEFSTQGSKTCSNSTKSDMCSEVIKKEESDSVLSSKGSSNFKEKATYCTRSRVKFIKKSNSIIIKKQPKISDDNKFSKEETEESLDINEPDTEEVGECNSQDTVANLDLFTTGFDEEFDDKLLDIVPARRTSPRNSALTRTQSSGEKKDIAVKKRSIFKSRNNSENKKRAQYKHKWHGHEEKDDQSKGKMELQEMPGESDDFAFDDTPTLKRVQTWPMTSAEYDDSFDEKPVVTSIKCSKDVKSYYTVIKNVKKTHQLQESGEFQEFNDDVEYFMDALNGRNSKTSTRCLACLNLAQKCMTPAFRMHLRAHGTVTKFFGVLSDATNSVQLSDCVALVMFILSQDHLNMDLDRDSLELMLNLLDTDATNRANSQNQDTSLENFNKIKQICKEMQQKGYAKHLNMECINAPTLAMETLLSLTSKRAGEWFKEELRELGGIDHLIRTVSSCSENVLDHKISWDSVYMENISKIDRCLKVLENVTNQNEANQKYLLNTNNSEFAQTLMKLYSFCDKEIKYKSNNDSSSTESKAVITNHITTMKVLINITHGSHGKEALGSKLLGKDKQIYKLTLDSLLILPSYLSHENEFEIQVLACCLLLNLTENSSANRAQLMNIYVPDLNSSEDQIFKAGKDRSAIEALVDLFYLREESAREQEAHTDNIIDHDLDKDNNDDKKDEEVEETVTKLLQKAGRHMEDTLIAAYTALLAGYCVMDNKEFEEQVREMQPEKHFKVMVSVLRKFLHFMNLTATTSLLRSLKPTEIIVKFMEELDKAPVGKQEKEKEEDEELELDAFGF